MTIEDVLRQKIADEEKLAQLQALAAAAGGGTAGYVAASGAQQGLQGVRSLMNRLPDSYMATRGYTPVQRPRTTRLAGMRLPIFGSMISGLAAGAGVNAATSGPGPAAEAYAALQTGNLTEDQALYIQDLVAQTVSQNPLGGLG